MRNGLFAALSFVTSGGGAGAPPTTRVAVARFESIEPSKADQVKWSVPLKPGSGK